MAYINLYFSKIVDLYYEYKIHAVIRSRKCTYFSALSDCIQAGLGIAVNSAHNNFCSKYRHIM